MKVFLVDGTYELFRQHFGAVRHHEPDSPTLLTAGMTGVLGGALYLLEQGATHIGVATDHVIESFRNDLWAGYKTGADIDPVLRAQFEPLEEALRALGVATWAMVDLEADDALATAAAVCAADPDVTQIAICTPDKDLAQCVRGGEIVQVDRRRDLVIDEAGVIAKYGVRPTSIPDWLALVGDAADGFPGLPGWGAKTAAAVLMVHGTIEAIPQDPKMWNAPVRGAANLARTLFDRMEDALLFKRLATLVVDPALVSSTADLLWTGPTPEFTAIAAGLGHPALAARAQRLATQRQ